MKSSNPVFFFPFTRRDVAWHGDLSKEYPRGNMTWSQMRNYPLSSRASFFPDLRFYSPHACPRFSVARLRDKRDGYTHRDDDGDDVVSFPAVKSARMWGKKRTDIDIRKSWARLLFPASLPLVPPTNTLDTPLSTYGDLFEARTLSLAAN